jgi:hypothetical protein
LGRSAQVSDFSWWAVLGSNQWPLPCERSGESLGIAVASSELWEYCEASSLTYKRFRQEGARHELHEFEREPSLEMAIERASLAEWPSGARFSHQRRIPAATLTECRRRLLRRVSEIRRCKSYEELHDFVAATVAGVYRAGPLYIYDTALRIGAKLGLAPSLVFLHAGALDGARALGFDRSCKTLSLSKLPKELRSLAPHEIEDVLCIYKAQLAGAAPIGTGKSLCASKSRRICGPQAEPKRRGREGPC